MASITLRISEEEKNKLSDFAKKDDLSISQVIRRAIREYLEKHSNK